MSANTYTFIDKPECDTEERVDTHHVHLLDTHIGCLTRAKGDTSGDWDFRIKSDLAEDVYYWNEKRILKAFRKHVEMEEAKVARSGGMSAVGAINLRKRTEPSFIT